MKAYMYICSFRLTSLADMVHTVHECPFSVDVGDRPISMKGVD